MHHLRSIRRVAIGAAVAGAAIGAMPALAGAATSHCTYDPNSSGVATIEDKSGPLPLRLSVTGTIIAVSNTLGGQQDLCLGGGTSLRPPTPIRSRFRATMRARSTATSSTSPQVPSAPAGPPRSTAPPELETIIANSGVAGRLKVIGTPGSDVIRIAGPLGGINYDSDTDIDLSVSSGSSDIEVEGRAG